jgi:hypothetical protein
MNDLPLRYLSIADAARMMHVTENWLLDNLHHFPRWAKLPDPPKGDSGIRIPKSELEEWIKLRDEAQGFDA